MHAKEYFKNNRNRITGCLSVILMTAALLEMFVLREGAPLFFDEGVAARKTLPCTLSPVLVAATLAAFFIDRGRTRAVGTVGTVLVAASAVVQMGCAIQLGSVDDPMYVNLYGYAVRLPFACLLIAGAFCAGGAAAVMLSMLSFARRSGSFMKEARCFSVIVAGGIAAASLSAYILGHMDIRWGHIAVALFLYIVLTVRLLLYWLHLEGDGWGSEPSTVPGRVPRPEQRGGLLWFGVIVLCTAAAVSYWMCLRKHWMEGHPGRWLENYLALSASFLALAVCLLSIGNRPRNAFRAVTGSALLVGGAPLVPAFQDLLLMDLAPQAVVGVGLAMVLGEALIPFLQVPARRYAAAWVGTAVLVAALGRVLSVALDRMEPFFRTAAVPLYTVYPLIFLGLMLVAHLAAKGEKAPAASAEVMNP